MTITAGFVIDEIDIWRAAQLMVKRYGEDGFIQAARANELLEQGDLNGQGVWKRIVAAIHELRQTKRRDDELVN